MNFNRENMNDKSEREFLPLQENLSESRNYDDQLAVQEAQQVFEAAATPSEVKFSKQDDLAEQLASAESQQLVLLEVLHKVPPRDKDCQETKQLMEPDCQQKLIESNTIQESQILMKQESSEELAVSQPISGPQSRKKEEVSQENIGDQPIQKLKVTVSKLVQDSHCGVEQALSEDASQKQLDRTSHQKENEEHIEVTVIKAIEESQHKIKKGSSEKYIELDAESTGELTEIKPNQESQCQEIAENQPIDEQSLTMHEQESSKDHDKAKQLQKEKQMSEVVEPQQYSENKPPHSDDKQDGEELSWSQISDNILKINAGVHSKLDMLLAAYNQQRTGSEQQHQEFKKRFEASFQREIDMIKCDVTRQEIGVDELEDVADVAMERSVHLTDDRKCLEEKLMEADEKLVFQKEHAAAMIGASQRKDKLFDAREARLSDCARDTDMREFNYLNELGEEEEMEEEMERRLDEEEEQLREMLERRANRWKPKNLKMFFSRQKSGSHEIKNTVEEGSLLATEQVPQNTSAKAQTRDPSNNLKDSPGKMNAFLKRFRRTRKQSEPSVSNIDTKVPCSSKQGNTSSNIADGDNETVSRSPSKASKLVMKLKSLSRGKPNGTRPNCI